MIFHPWKLFQNVIQQNVSQFFCPHCVNSLAPGRFWMKFLVTNFQTNFSNWWLSYFMWHDIALKWLSLDLTDDKSALILLMVWCPQAARYFLSQCWLKSMSPFGVTRPQWLKSILFAYGYELDIPLAQCQVFHLLSIDSSVIMQTSHFLFTLMPIGVIDVIYPF